MTSPSSASFLAMKRAISIDYKMLQNSVSWCLPGLNGKITHPSTGKMAVIIKQKLMMRLHESSLLPIEEIRMDQNLHL